MIVEIASEAMSKRYDSIDSHDWRRSSDPAESRTNSFQLGFEEMTIQDDHPFKSNNFSDVGNTRPTSSEQQTLISSDMKLNSNRIVTTPPSSSKRAGGLTLALGSSPRLSLDDDALYSPPKIHVDNDESLSKRETVISKHLDMSNLHSPASDNGSNTTPDSPLSVNTSSTLSHLKKTWSFSCIQDMNAIQKRKQSQTSKNKSRLHTASGLSNSGRKSQEETPQHPDQSRSSSSKNIAAWDGLRSTENTDLDTAESSDMATDNDEEQETSRHDGRQQVNVKPAASAAILATRSSALSSLLKPTYSSPNLREAFCKTDSNDDHDGGILLANRERSFRRFKDCYNIGKTIGTGGFAVVRECVNLKTGERCAVKIMNVGTSLGECEDDQEEMMTREEIINELVLMQKLDHPNIIKTHEFFLTDAKCYIVMDLMHGPELMDALESHGEYTERDVKKVMMSLLDAISYMHANRVTHRDLKLENLILARKNDISSVTIVDFGLAKSIRKRQKMEEICGTPWYAAPELLMEKPYTNKVDVWSAGVSMYVLLTGNFPFDDEDDDEDAVMDQVLSPEAVSFQSPEFEKVSMEAIDLLGGLLEKNPKHRLSACDALEHTFFTGIITHDARTLNHVHERIQNLIELRRQQLPKVTFSRSQIIAQGSSLDDFQDAFLIKKGVCHIVVKETPKQDLSLSSSASSVDQSYKNQHRTSSGRKIATLREGNFIGFLDMTFNNNGATNSCSKVNNGSTCLSSSASSLPLSHILRHGVIDNDNDNDNATGYDSKSNGNVNDFPSSTRILNNVNRGAKTYPSCEMTVGTHESFFLSMLGSLEKDNLIGKLDNHNNDVHIMFVAASDVLVALRLSHDDMHWAVEQDFRMTDDFSRAIRMRRRKLRKMERDQRLFNKVGDNVDDNGYYKYSDQSAVSF